MMRRLIPVPFLSLSDEQLCQILEHKLSTGLHRFQVDLTSNVGTVARVSAFNAVHLQCI